MGPLRAQMCHSTTYIRNRSEIEIVVSKHEANRSLEDVVDVAQVLRYVVRLGDVSAEQYVVCLCTPNFLEQQIDFWLVDKVEMDVGKPGDAC